VFGDELSSQPIVSCCCLAGPLLTPPRSQGRDGFVVTASVRQTPLGQTPLYFPVPQRLFLSPSFCPSFLYCRWRLFFWLFTPHAGPSFIVKSAVQPESLVDLPGRFIPPPEAHLCSAVGHGFPIFPQSPQADNSINFLCRFELINRTLLLRFSPHFTSFSFTVDPFCLSHHALL